MLTFISLKLAYVLLQNDSINLGLSPSLTRIIKEIILILNMSRFYLK